MILHGRALTPGDASGTVLKLDTPLSFWGGVDLQSGEIIDRSHPRNGTLIGGRVIAMQVARGSSSSSSALAELARSSLAPAGIIMTQFDPILVIGSLVVAELYRIEIPIALISESDWPLLREGDTISLAAVGAHARLEVEPSRLS